MAGAIEGCMEVIRRELHETARSSCGHALVEFSAHLKMLQRRPNSLKEFAAFIDAKAAITAQVRSLYQLATAVDEMYAQPPPPAPLPRRLTPPPRLQVPLTELHRSARCCC